MIAIVLAGFLFLSSYYSHVTNNWYWHDYQTVEELAICCDTPDKLVTWARGYITTDKFKEYDWQSIEGILWTQEGDCKAYAVLYYEVLRRQGYTPHIICVWKKEKSHAVCVCRIDGDWCILDNSGIEKTPAFNLAEVPYYVYPDFVSWHEKDL